MDEYLIRNLPDGTDMKDAGGALASRFDYLRLTDDVNQFRRILLDYVDADPDVREVMNNLFLNLCGYSLPSLVEGVRQQL